MTRQVVFVHGRSQQHKDGGSLKQQWISDWQTGLKKSGLTLPIAATDVHFPYYGDTLDQLSNGVPIAQAAKIIVKGQRSPDASGGTYDIAILDEIRRRWEITDAQLDEIAGRRVTDKGVQNWPIVLAILRALDTHVPNASSQAIALFTQDVDDYLTNQDIRDAIDDGFAQAMTKATETGREVIVVAHSLGTVVAYNALMHHADRGNWTVPLLVTVGSPLAISAIKEAIRNLGAPREQRVPENVTTWFNAMDAHDVVALYPLDDEHFPVDPAKPAIFNKVDVDNETSNRHGICGYLGDKEVAEKIFTAVGGTP